MEPSLDRRRLPDRRRCPTTLWSALRLAGPENELVSAPCSLSL